MDSDFFKVANTHNRRLALGAHPIIVLDSDGVRMLAG
jgi:hypothetical protein